MTNIAKWSSPSSATTILSTELDSLSNGAMSAASSAITNNTDLNMYVDIEVNLASLSPAAGTPYVALYILEALDGTNYPAQSDADFRLTSTQLLIVVPIGVAAATAQRIIARNVVIPPGLFKIKLDNQAGVALAASGSTVKFITYNTNLNG